MSYKLTNLSGTRRDPNKRGRKSPLVRRAAGGLRIGHRPLKAGATISIDESGYQANKDHIDAHIAAGVIELQVMGEAAERAEVRVHAPSPTPPEPPPPTKVEPIKVEISPSSSEEPGEGSVFSKMKSTILNMASSEEPPKQEAAPKKKTVAKKTYESSEAKESRSRRRKKKSEDE